MFKTVVNVNQLIYFRVTQVADQLFKFKLYTAYSCVLEELKRVSICLSKETSLLDKQLKFSRVPL